MNPLILTDYYKTEHFKMYPQNMTRLYSNLTPRKSRIEGINGIVVFGIQHFILTYLIEKFNKEFFGGGGGGERIKSQRFKKDVIDEYKRHINVDTKHIEALWDLGYLPIEIKALPEGTICPIGVPCLTIKNTRDDFGWIVNYLETLLSCSLWLPITSATIAHEYRKILDRYAIETTGTTEGVQWQGHDFSMRGMSSVESAILSGMGHLLSFTGTDTVPAIYQLESSYNASGLIGASVPATEHSVMCMGQKEEEIQTFIRLLNLYPKGILSVVSDTWDLWKVLTDYLPTIKDLILARDGKLVIRPDSGNPADIICGYYENKGANKLAKIDTSTYEKYIDLVGKEHAEFKSEAAYKGVIELLWDTFGGTVNEKGYKVLDSHIGAIYGDGISLLNLTNILDRLKAKGFASTNIVFGFGSYGYQYQTRDTFGFAMKATYGELTHCNGAGGDNLCCKDINKPFCENATIEAREIFKDPITDDGTKKSKKGLLLVLGDKDGNNISVHDQQDWEQEKLGMLKTVFLNGQLVNPTTLEEIRNRLNN